MQSLECQTRGFGFSLQPRFHEHYWKVSPPFLAKPEAYTGDPWLLNCPQDHGPSYSYMGSEAMRLELRAELGIQQQATCLFWKLMFD